MNDAGRADRERFAELAQLAGGLAHEIRNPLSTIRLNLELLAEDFRDATDPRERRSLQKIDRVKRESRRLEGLLEDFLRFARVQALETAPADLNAVVDDLCDFFEPEAAAREIVLRRHLADGLPPVALDEDLFKQALFNLVRNAEHAMPDGGELLVTTRAGDPASGPGSCSVLLELTDTGQGIAPEVLPRIFEPFYSTRPGGTGLGLPTVRRIVEAHGGTIEVASETGKGSRFTILVPALTCDPPGPGGPR
jgi:signal transduction histidine kinase